MKKLVLLSFFVLLSGTSFAKKITRGDVQKLVTQVCTEIEAAKGEVEVKKIFEKINKAEHPYTDKEDSSFYAFVYNKDVVIVAHPTANLVNQSQKGKGDVQNKLFRDNIVSGALKDKMGWEEYVYSKPGDAKILPKIAFYKLCPNGGVDYIVVSGMYKD